MRFTLALFYNVFKNFLNVVHNKENQEAIFWLFYNFELVFSQLESLPYCSTVNTFNRL